MVQSGRARTPSPLSDAAPDCRCGSLEHPDRVFDVIRYPSVDR